MKRRVGMGLALVVVTGGLGWLVGSGEADARGKRGDVVVFVRSQGLYYDSIITKDPLPSTGRFQLLSMGPNGLETDLGPGDAGYLGGRWMEDFDGDGKFHYFLCPLLPPGRENP